TQRLGDRPVRFGCSKAYLPVDSDIYTCLGLYLIALVGRQADIDRTVCPRIVRHAYQHLGLQRFPGSQSVGVALEPHVPAAVAGMCCEADLCSVAAAVVYADGSRQALAKGLVGSDLCSSKIQVQFEFPGGLCGWGLACKGELVLIIAVTPQAQVALGA